VKTVEIEVRETVKLIDFIEANFPNCSKTKRKEILQRRVMVASHNISKFDYMLQPGMKVTIVGDEKKKGLMGGRMTIAYEDRNFVVVNKPVGLLSSSGDPNDRTVISELNAMFIKRRSKTRAHVVHRLDRDTSGLLLVAKTKEMAREMEKDWKEKVYDRLYIGVAWGAPEPPSGTVKSWLTDNEWGVVSSPVDNGGKLSITHYQTVQKKGRFALVKMKLDTGRRNQIRVHMRELGHPLLKDPIYGYRDDNSPIDRLALHAYRLCFHHPVTGKDVELETEIPEEFMKLFKKS